MRFRELRIIREANVVNPRDIDDWVENRISKVRRHYPEARRNLIPWLAKRVRQHIVSLTDEQASRMMKPVSTDPQGLDMMTKQYGDWVQAAHQRGETLFRFDWTLSSMMSPVQNAVIHVIDYIISLDAVATQPQPHEASLQDEAARHLSKITRLTMEQAVSHADNWFEALQAAGREYAELAEARSTKSVLEFADGYRWVQITDTQALDREGDIMGHCVGGGSYDTDLQKDECRIYSLRDPRNEPHVTIESRLWREWDDEAEAYVAGDGSWVIEQVKGKQNEAPVAKYRPYLKAFLNRLELDPSEEGFADIENAGLYRHPSEPRYGTLREATDLVLTIDDLEVRDYGSKETLYVMRGDTGLGSIKHMGNRTPQVGNMVTQGSKFLTEIIDWIGDSREDIKSVFSALAKQGYHFYSGVLEFLIDHMLVPRNDILIDATELPPETQVGSYRLVFMEIPNRKGYVWIMNDSDTPVVAMTLTTRSRQGFRSLTRDIAQVPQPSDCTLELAQCLVSFLNDHRVQDNRPVVDGLDPLSRLVGVNSEGSFVPRRGLKSRG